MIRPERVKLKPADATGENYIPGMVDRVVYLGNANQVIARLAHGETVQALVQNTGDEFHSSRATRSRCTCRPRRCGCSPTPASRRSTPPPSAETMEQRLSVVTLGVADLERAHAFYGALGWTAGTEPGADVVFYQAGGMIIGLWDRAKLAEDSGITDDNGGWGGIALAYNTRSPEEVDEVIAQARAAGATIAREGGDVLGRLLGRVHRSRRPPLGGRPQPVLDDQPGRQISR